MLRFTQVDVFTAVLLSGNPVAVVHDADSLTSEQMAALARWTNLSETAFLLRPEDPSADYRLRIFTPAREIPFAGHPTIGAARAWLAAGGTPRDPDRLVQQCGAGLVALRRDLRGGPHHDAGRLAFAAPPLVRSGPLDESELARCAEALGIAAGDVVDAQWVDNGPGWAAVLLRDAASVLALRPDVSRFGDLHLGVVGPQRAEADSAVEVRAFTPLISSGEDPVTGSLNAGIAGWLMDTGRVGESYVATQGTAMRRRGRVFVDRVDGQIWVGGDTVIGVVGTLALD